MASRGSTSWLGLIADTHGRLHPAALEALEGAERILHAGDIGPDRSLLEVLETLAPTVAVRGNVDRAFWAQALPETAWVEWRGLAIYLIHDLEALDLEPRAAGLAAVVHGHTHRPSVSSRSGVWYVNPGSASFPRGEWATVARLHLSAEGLRPEIVRLT